MAATALAVPVEDIEVTAAAGVALTKPKKGPKSRVAVKPGRYRPGRLVPKASSSTGKPSLT
jgi:hypothetical protein